MSAGGQTAQWKEQDEGEIKATRVERKWTAETRHGGSDRKPQKQVD